MSQNTRSSSPDGSSIVEGLPGRLPFLVSSLTFFLVTMILFSIRNALHSGAASIDFDALGSWFVPGIVLLLVVAPLMHTGAHALALLVLRVPMRWARRLVYPRVRAGAPVSRSAAIRILLAPLGLSLLLLLLLAVRSLSSFATLWNAVNLALSINDIWKALGLRRFGPAALVEMNSDHCRLVER